MARRNRMPRRFVDIHRLRGGPEPSLNRGILGPAPVNPVVAENEQLNTLRAHVYAVRKELAEARRELENEKKANQKLVEQKRVMEKNLESMAHELEELRAELMSINMRGHELGGGSSDAMPNITYPGEGAPMIDSSYAMPLQQASRTLTSNAFH
ncbi:unnamed protein product [Amaranthus hypochondriacus]